MPEERVRAYMNNYTYKQAYAREIQTNPFFFSPKLRQHMQTFSSGYPTGENMILIYETLTHEI